MFVENSVDSVYIGGYGGLSESSPCVFPAWCPVSFLVVGECPSVCSSLLYVNCGDDSVCWVVHDVRLYSVLDTVVISGEAVCCSVVFGTLVGVFIYQIYY